MLSTISWSRRSTWGCSQGLDTRQILTAADKKYKSWSRGNILFSPSQRRNSYIGRARLSASDEHVQDCISGASPPPVWGRGQQERELSSSCFVLPSWGGGGATYLPTYPTDWVSEYLTDIQEGGGEGSGCTIRAGKQKCAARRQDWQFGNGAPGGRITMFLLWSE